VKRAVRCIKISPTSARYAESENALGRVALLGTSCVLRRIVDKLQSDGSPGRWYAGEIIAPVKLLDLKMVIHRIWGFGGSEWNF
jgi:hypothetical protein